MTGPAILDTGPLIAALDSDERHHAWALNALHTIRPPLLTCEAVLSEACFLLRRLPDAVTKIESYCAEGQIVVDFDFSSKQRRVFALMRKYADRPMSFADACLVCMVEDGPGSTVFTLDGDFRVYRQKNRQVIPVISPQA